MNVFAAPALFARILNGAGRINVRQGAVMTVQGLGASLDPALWLGFGSALKPPCGEDAQTTQNLSTRGAPA